MLVRILRIFEGEKVDEEGREVSSDWLLADFGEFQLGNKYANFWVTTDNLTANQVAELDAVLNPACCAMLLRDSLQERITSLIGQEVYYCPSCGTAFLKSDGPLENCKACKWSANPSNEKTARWNPSAEVAQVLQEIKDANQQAVNALGGTYSTGE